MLFTAIRSAAAGLPVSGRPDRAGIRTLCRQTMRVVTGSVMTGSVVTGSVVTGSVVTGSVVTAGLLLRPTVALAQGMPQLDFATPLTISQVVWGAIIFVVLYLILSRQGLPLVTSVLEERAGHIGRDLEGAREAKGRADAGIGEATTATAKARAEAQAAVNAAVDEAKRKAAAEAEVLNTRLETRLHEAEAQIAQARTAALGALRQVATDTAIGVVTRLTGTAPDTAHLDRAVDAALSARGVAQRGG